MEDLTAVIEDSINDAGLEDAHVDDTPEPEPVEAAVEAEAPAESAPSEEADPDKTVVDSFVKPVEKEEPVKVTDADEAFSKKFGIPARSVTGRENRIPYSRVKKIVEKNEKEVIERLTKENEGKWSPKVKEYEDKVKDYETRLKKVGEFEQYVYNQPRDFLETLSQIPAYKPFFDHINKLAEQLEAGGSAAAPAGQPAQPALPNDPADPRPMPNKALADGSKVYDMDGLDALLAWQGRQVAKAVKADTIKEITARYAPIEEERQLALRKKEHLAKLEPVINKQIADAKTWPHFVEHEGDILKALEADQSLSLEGAYRQVLNSVVLPKLTTDRNAIRAEVLAELRKKPASTTAPVSRTAPNPPPTGPRTLEQIIEAEMAKLGG